MKLILANTDRLIVSQAHAQSDLPVKSRLLIDDRASSITAATGDAILELREYA